MVSENRERIAGIIIGITTQLHTTLSERPALDGRVSVDDEVVDSVRMAIQLSQTISEHGALNMTDFIRDYTQVSVATVFNLINLKNRRVSKTKLLQLLEDIQNYVKEHKYYETNDTKI